MVIAVKLRYPAREILPGVGWDVLIFVAGIFVVVRGLRNVGITGLLGGAIAGLAGDGMLSLNLVAGLVAGTCSSLMNNHPTAGLMTFVIQDFGLPLFETRMMVYSALIGGDLGPKMLPVGSPAALLWFRILRARGAHIPYGLYVRIGVPVTMAAIVASVLALMIELWWMG